MSDWVPDIARLQTFDDQEWLEVERHYCGRLLAYVSRRVQDREAREDILQETLLGSVRGIGDFDSLYSFEQYLFGICHNRTIDHLRRARLHTISSNDEEDGPNGLDGIVDEADSPSRVVRREDLARHTQQLLGDVLRDWVQETWAQSEFVRLMVIEALFSAGWRNKDTWSHFELRDETAVAGIKFRALKRMRELAKSRDEGGRILQGILEEDEANTARLDFSVAQVWRNQRVSCPARYWLGRSILGTLAAGPTAYVKFHTEDMNCPWCLANLEDLEALEQDPALEPMRERVQASTLQFLRSRAQPID